MFEPRFDLGRILITPGAAQVLEDVGQQPIEYLSRHIRGDWGDLAAGDSKANDVACQFEGDVNRQERIMSSYKTSKSVKIWVITEWDRSMTTLLLPEEY